MTPWIRESHRRLQQRREAIEKLAWELHEEDTQLHRAPDGDDVIDLAALREPQPVLQSLRDCQRQEMAEIDAALRRIQRGTYGVCELCGRDIARQRLRAVPSARACLACTSAVA
ncbi:MAG TPA: TraR/DksA C4-type zinc finger protein [Myxococcales bacterium]|nr:TraR/DksA C4-type zinc finger protein [Myxococcales bacterium]